MRTLIGQVFQQIRYVVATPLADQAPPPSDIGVFVTLAGGLLVAGTAIRSLICQK